MKDCTDFTSELPENLLKNLFTRSLEELARHGAELMLKLALESEIKEFLSRHSSEKTSSGCPRIVRNGYNPERKIQTGIGELSIKVPRTRDRLNGLPPSEQIKYESLLIPKYLRRCESIDDLIPFLYLNGISSTRFSDVLSLLLGKPVSLSPNILSRLKDDWQREYKSWQKNSFQDKRYIYWWVDGVHFKIREEKEKICTLVIIGATQDGTKELVAMDMGYSESELTWKEILEDLRNRGLKEGPRLAIGDGALGFWKAINKVFPDSRHQRCWVHRTKNVLNKLPKSLQSNAKKSLHDIYQAPTKKEAEKEFDKFVNVYEAKYPKAVKCLLKTKEETMAFYDFPAQHWRHIRSTNVIESVFASVRLRTYKTKGCCSSETVLPMAFQLIIMAQKRWQKIHGYNIIPMVFNGDKFTDGVPNAAQYKLFSYTTFDNYPKNFLFFFLLKIYIKFYQFLNVI